MPRPPRRKRYGEDEYGGGYGGGGGGGYQSQPLRTSMGGSSSQFAPRFGGAASQNAGTSTWGALKTELQPNQGFTKASALVKGTSGFSNPMPAPKREVKPAPSFTDQYRLGSQSGTGKAVVVDGQGEPSKPVDLQRFEVSATHVCGAGQLGCPFAMEVRSARSAVTRVCLSSITKLSSRVAASFNCPNLPRKGAPWQPIASRLDVTASPIRYLTSSSHAAHAQSTAKSSLQDFKNLLPPDLPAPAASASASASKAKPAAKAKKASAPSISRAAALGMTRKPPPASKGWRSRR